MKSKQLLPVLNGIVILVLMVGNCTPAIQNPPTSVTYVYDGENYVPASGTAIPQTTAPMTVTKIARTTTPTTKTPTYYPIFTPTPAYTAAVTTFTPAITPTTLPSTTVPTSPTTSVVITVGNALVTKVIDGDTIEVQIQGKPYRVRYIGIDTPELAHDDHSDELFAIEATIKNRELVDGKIVRLEKDMNDTDGHGRLLRYVYVGDTFVNGELVRLGYAKATPYPPDVKYQTLLLSFENQAKSLQLGIWAKRYVGSKNSTKYHLPSCPWAQKITPENEIWFFSATDAKTKGYLPCGVCKPSEYD